MSKFTSHLKFPNLPSAGLVLWREFVSTLKLYEECEEKEVQKNDKVKVEKGLSLISSHNCDLRNDEFLLMQIAEIEGGDMGAGGFGMENYSLKYSGKIQAN